MRDSTICWDACGRNQQNPVLRKQSKEFLIRSLTSVICMLCGGVIVNGNIVIGMIQNFSVYICAPCPCDGFKHVVINACIFLKMQDESVYKFVCVRE